MGKIFIGTSGYNYNHWRGIFYPQDINSKNFFSFYQNYFQTVEINYTFYHFPKKNTFENWYKNSSSNFNYTLKVPKSITHLKKLNECEDLIKKFIEYSLELKEKLGIILFQMPPSFHFNNENINKIENLIKILPNSIKFALEFRHKSWFYLNNELNFLEGKNFTVVIVSAPGIPFKVYNLNTFFYIRLHGKNSWYNYDYSDDELYEIANIIYKNINYNFWIYFNNDFNGYAVKNALKLKEILKIG